VIIVPGLGLQGGAPSNERRPLSLWRVWPSKSAGLRCRLEREEGRCLVPEVAYQPPPAACRPTSTNPRSGTGTIVLSALQAAPRDTGARVAGSGARPWRARLCSYLQCPPCRTRCRRSLAKALPPGNPVAIGLSGSWPEPVLQLVRCEGDGTTSGAPMIRHHAVRGQPGACSPTQARPQALCSASHEPSVFRPPATGCSLTPSPSIASPSTP